MRVDQAGVRAFPPCRTRRERMGHRSVAATGEPLSGADQQAGDVVLAAGLVGRAHQPGAELIEGQIEAQQGFEKRIGELAGETVRAEKEEIAGLRLKLEDVRRDLLL